MLSAFVTLLEYVQIISGSQPLIIKNWFNIQSSKAMSHHKGFIFKVLKYFSES